MLTFLNERKSGAGKNQIGEKVDELEAQLAAVNKSLDEYLQEIELSKVDLEFRFKWQIAWTKYLEQKLNDEFLQAHFDGNKRLFDGTEIRVAHLFLKSDTPSPSDPSTQSKRTEMLATAKGILVQLQSDEIGWEQAVKKFSQAPTSDSAGDIGWIKNDGPMPKSFTDAAFELSLNQISEPVETSFGIHLIKCLEIKEGEIGWQDNLEKLKADAANFLFLAIVKKYRPTMKIE